MNKSLTTNLIGIALIGLGYTVPLYGDHVLTIGLFATSGAFTNWLAIHMLFEKIPGIYGSGVIPNRFEELKAKIQFLIKEEFFSRDNVQDLLASSVPGEKKFFNTNPIVEAIDYDRVFAGFVDVLLSTPFGGVLRLVGGSIVFNPLKDPFKTRMKDEVRTLLASDSFAEAVQTGLEESDVSKEVVDHVDHIVSQRLDGLTPEMIKLIIKNIIRDHLEWLVVWGGVFGALIGLAASLLP